MTAAVLALALAGGAALTYLYQAQPSDRVSESEVRKRDEAYRQFRQVLVSAVPPERVEHAVSAMKLPAADRDALKRDLAAPASAAPATVAKTRAAAAPAQQPVAQGLIELTLWDTDAEDGDVVRVVNGGFSQEVVLARTPVLLFIPYDGSGVIQVVGVRDGGGGITLGVRGSDNSLSMPVMSEGQTLLLPVRLR